jgi:hypothetical protein
MKLHTNEQLESKLDAYIAWRRKELRELRGLILASELPAKATYARAGIALAYAHWEGFVKEAAEAYLWFVANQKLKLNELANNFWALCAQRLNKTNKITEHIAVAELFRNSTPGNPIFHTKINTRMNLNSTVLREILLSLGLETSKFETIANFIDSELLGARNKIAHGEVLSVPWKGSETVLERTEQLLIDVRIEISNGAAMKKYRAN